MMTDEVFFGVLILFVILSWYFAIRKTVCHYQLIRNSKYGFLAKFFILGIPFIFILPKNTVNESNSDLYKKGRNYYFLFLSAIAFSYFTFFVWMIL
jgi:hypothetical protein